MDTENQWEEYRHKTDRNKERGQGRIQIESSSGRRETKPDRKKSRPAGRQTWILEASCGRKKEYRKTEKKGRQMQTETQIRRQTGMQIWKQAEKLGRQEEKIGRKVCRKRMKDALELSGPLARGGSVGLAGRSAVW
jgi:hypothetical protein